MKILHTADWHMNDRLGRIDRSRDILRNLECIATYLEDYAVDVMLVAGDVFREHCSREEIREAISHIKRIFKPFLERGGTIVAISGNHDSATYFDTLYDTLDLAAPVAPNGDGISVPGRLYVAPKPDLLRLADKAGCVTQFVLLPYPDGRYLDVNNLPGAPSERNREIHRKYKEVLDYLTAQIDPHQPAVLVSHVYVRGATLRSAYKISEANDVVFEQGDIPTQWAYVAYGHIHNPQCAVEGAEHIRYSGSIERLDMGEQNDSKSVVLFEVGPEGRQGTPQLLPLDCAPIYDIVITDIETDLPNLLDDAQYPDAERALVRYVVHRDKNKHDVGNVHRQVRARFPRWYNCEERGSDQDDVNLSDVNLLEVRKNVIEYLEQKTKLSARDQKDAEKNENNAKKQQRDELLSLADQLLLEENF